MFKNFLFLFIGILLLSLLGDNAFGENDSIRLELTYPNGDRMPIGNSILFVSSDDGVIEIEAKGENSDHYFELDLPLGKKYEILVFSQDMLIGVKYLNIENKILDVIKIPVNHSIGLKFFGDENEGKTPIENAGLEIFSHKGNVIKTTITDAEGKTQRFWLPSTITDGDFYKVQVSIDDLSYEYPPIRRSDGSHDFKIETNWPPIVDSIVIQTLSDKIPNYSWGKNFVAQIYSEDKLEQSANFVGGKAYFSHLSVGKHRVVILDENNPLKILADTKISIKDNSGQYAISTGIHSDLKSNLVDSLPSMQDQILKSPSDKNIEFSKLKWTKQSKSGLQENIVESESFLKILTEGDSNAVFTRSESFVQTDFSDKDFQISYKIDKPNSVKEFWLYFTSDNFESSWYTIKISSSEILSNKKISKTFNLNDAVINGIPDPTKINQVQIRIKDHPEEKVKLEIFGFNVLKKNNSSIVFENNSNLEGCPCVAFRLDDIQDFFLNDVQMELIDTFLENKVKLTIGVIGAKIGNDPKLTTFLKYNKDNPYLKFANHGWKHEDFTQFSKDGQENLMLLTNEKISNLFGVDTKLFVPPQNKFNDKTISALNALGFTHYSSDLIFSEGPFPLYGQKLYNFPETAYTGKLNEEGIKFVGTSHQITLDQIDQSIDEFGFAVVTLHPQEFSYFGEKNYQNKLNQEQIRELKALLSKLAGKNVKITFITEINSETVIVPWWLKNTAKLWAEEKINDITFVNGLEFLLNEQKIKFDQTENEKVSSVKIPIWIKKDIQWWAENKISDTEFVNSIQFLVNQKIIQF